ncbi:MAG: DUF4157 domain-containing protein [Acidobacteria bacterium]|nr:DUF4157 domain-containing protein [Acidobacteriota bacterium]
MPRKSPTPILPAGKPAPRVVQPVAAAAPNRHPQHAPPVFKPAQPRAAQPKLATKVAPKPPVVAPTRPAAPSASGAVQANLVGGANSLKARAKQPPAPVARTQKPAVANENRPAPVKKPAPIQRKGRPGVEAFKVSLQPKSGGMPLPEDVRAKMEVAMGTDFSDVRIHVGREASSIGALAYTWGTNIHFAPGQYNPHSLQGQKILGHELWHVVQQKMGRVSNPLGGGVAVVQDHALEAEADRMGIKAALTVLPRKSGEK